MDKISALMTVYSVRTLVDNGIRITLDMSENDIMQMAQFVECKRFGAVLKAEFTPDLQAETGNNGKDTNQLATRAKRKSEWTPAEEPRPD